MKVALKDLSGGVNTDKEDYEVADNQWTDVNNVTFREGKLQKAKGYSEVYTTPGCRPQWLIPYYDANNGDYHWVYPGIDDSGNGKIFSVTGTTHTDRTRASGGNYSPNALIPWSGGILNGLLVVNNGIDIPQKWDRTGGTLNADFENLANWPSGYKARIIRPFRDFFIAMDIDDTAGGGNPTRNPFRVMWSDAVTGFAEPSAWLAAANNLAGDVYLAEGGDHVIDGAPLRGNFIIYKENSTYIMRYVGGNTVMAVDRLYNEIGIIAPRCFAAFGEAFHFVVTKGDIIVHDGNTARSVADDVVRKKIFDEIDSTNYVLSWCTPFYKEEEIWFCYPTSDAFVYKAAIWNYKTGAWTFRDLPKSQYMEYGIVDTSGVSGDWNSDSEAWDADSTSWNRFVYNPSAYDLLLASRGATDTTANAKFYQMESGNTKDGTNMTAYARKTGIDLEDPQSIKYVRRLYPVLRDGPVDFRVGYAMAQEGPYTWCDPMTYTTTTDHKLDVRCTGRYMAIEIQSTGNVDWGLDQVIFELEQHGLR